MQCVILAAGEGVRMRPLTNDRPKPMVLLAGKPILEHIMGVLPDDIDEVILVVGYMADKIKDHFGSKFGGRKIRYVFQEAKLGTYHGLAICRPYLKEERFLMLYADDLLDKKGLERLIAAQGPCLQVAWAEHPERFGVVETHKDGSISRIEEKPDLPRTNLVSAGAKVLDHRIFDYPAERHANGEYYLTDSLAQMLAAGHTIRTAHADFWFPIGYPEDVKKAERILAKT